MLISRSGWLLLFVGACLFSICFACKGSKEDEMPTEETMNIGEIREEVRQLMNDYNDAIREGGLLTEFKYLEQSSDFYWVPPGYNRSLSYEEVADIININAARYKWIDNAWESLKVFPLTNDLASYTGIVRSTMMDTSDQVTRFILLESGIARRGPTGWKILSGQTRTINEGLE